MRRFIYAPDVQAYIATQEHGIVDVTSDITSGQVNRVLDGASTAELTLNSPNRKYLRIFKPMDRIAIYLTRTKPVLVFSGYLDRAPLDQLYPGPITINASCTIKRLLYTYWDPSLSYTVQWFAKHGWTWDIGTGTVFSESGKSMWNLDLNGTIGHMMREVMHDIGNWPIGGKGEGRNTVHILGLPDAFLKKTQSMIAKEIDANQEQFDNIMKFLKALLTVEGIYSDPFAAGGNSASFTSTQVDDNPLSPQLAGGYHALIYGPAYSLSGLAGAIKKEATKDGVSITAAQAQAGALVYGAVKKAGYNDNAAAAWVAAAFAESHLNAGIQEGGGGPGSGLFQLTSDNFFGPSGILAGIARQENPNYSGNPQRIGSGIGDNGAAAANPAFNVLAIMHNAIGLSNPVTDVNVAADPLNIIVTKFLRPASPSGDLQRGGTIINAIKRASTSATQTSGKTSAADEGTVGDVKVGNADLISNKITPDKSTTQMGMTFRIKDNPYGDDSMIFRAVKHDPKLDDHEIAIYVPGAKDKSSPQAEAWTNKTVVLETSYNRAERFPANASANASSSATSPTTPSAPSAGSGKYVNPFARLKGLVPERTDQGVDYAAQSGPILAIGKAKIIGVRNDATSGWPGSFMWYELLDGDNAGRFVFVAEGIDPLVGPGQVVEAGTPIANYRSGWHAGTEHGFATAEGHVIDPYAGRPDGTQTEGGKMFARFLKSLGVPVSQDPGPGPGATNSGGGTVPNPGTTPDATGGTVYGGSGVSINQTTIAQIAASTSYGLGLVFPLVSDAAEAVNFTGKRALQNDVPLMDWVKFMCTASGRRFQSLPNGDFMAFYPDYFNWSKEAPYWIISDIETQDLTIDISDERLATHVFTTADSFSPNGQIDLDDRLASTVASVESMSTFRDLIGVTDEFDGTKFLKRYGARPMTEEVPEIKNSFMQFMYGWMTFLKQWASMFYSTPTFTFMPELYPGGLIEFKSKDLVMFVESVTHNFDRESGFTTTASLMAPSTRTKQYSFPMVLADGGYKQAAAKKAVPVAPYRGPH